MDYISWNIKFLKTDVPINMTTDSTITIDPETKSKISLYSYMVPVIGILIIIINFAVVLSSGLILKNGRKPRSTYLLLGNVAMSDFLTGIAVLFGNFYPKDQRDFNFCAIELGLILSSTVASVYSVGLIAVDRYLYIIYGMQYTVWVTTKRVRLLIVAAWSIGCALGFAPLMGWHQNDDDGKFCWYIRIAPKSLIILTVLIGVTPIFIIIILYSIILNRAIQKIIQYKREHQGGTSEKNLTRGNLRMFRGRQQNVNQQNLNKSGIFKIFKPTRTNNNFNKWKTIKVVIFTTGSFVFTWMPYLITCVIYVARCEHDSTEKHCITLRNLIASPLAILGFMNSLLNPIIYAWWHNGFRNYFTTKWQHMNLRRKSKSNTVNHSRKKTNVSLSEGSSQASNKSSARVTTDSEISHQDHSHSD